MPHRNCWSCLHRARDAESGVSRCLIAELDAVRRWRRTFAMVNGMPPRAADFCGGYDSEDAGQQAYAWGQLKLVRIDDGAGGGVTMVDEDDDLVFDWPAEVARLEEIIADQDTRIFNLENRLAHLEERR